MTTEYAPAQAKSLNPDEQTALDHVFSYHAPDAAAIAHMQELRESAKSLASLILQVCPRCADRSAAIRQVREAVMSANASIALGGKNLP